ncbi:hypothetical protein [Kiloniella litopenaei]|uniref:hypothetical protein n=1 Tax=Kiloniella litopenaei TaxID=1549748 RepID=UPI000696556F|nr:hypothetical protein [Kiloniella litopenaei]
MADIIHKLKHNARILHRNITTGKQASLAFIKKNPDFKNLSDLEIIETVKRKHCLSQIAKALGFKGWSHLSQIIQMDSVPAPTNERTELDYGKLLCPPRCMPYTNFWTVFYPEAKEHRDQTNGYLLTYGTQFLVTEQDYIETLGLDPKDADWDLIGYDWANPENTEARDRLYQKLITRNLKDQVWL